MPEVVVRGGTLLLEPDPDWQWFGWDGRISLFDYFSLVTLTTMGYGDVTPVHGPARTFALIEAVFGQFYIAVLVAQLVGLRLAQAMQPNDAGG